MKLCGADPVAIVCFERGFDVSLRRICFCGYDRTDVASQTTLQPACHTSPDTEEVNKCPSREGDIEKYHYDDTDHGAERCKALISARMGLGDDFITDDE